MAVRFFLGYSRIIFTHFNDGSQGSYSSFIFFYGTRVFQSHVIQLCVLTYNFRLYKYYNRYGIALWITWNLIIKNHTTILSKGNFFCHFFTSFFSCIYLNINVYNLFVHIIKTILQMIFVNKIQWKIILGVYICASCVTLPYIITTYTSLFILYTHNINAIFSFSKCCWYFVIRHWVRASEIIKTNIKIVSWDL